MASSRVFCSSSWCYRSQGYSCFQFDGETFDSVTRAAGIGTLRKDESVAGWAETIFYCNQVAARDESLSDLKGNHRWSISS